MEYTDEIAQQELASLNDQVQRDTQAVATWQARSVYWTGKRDALAAPEKPEALTRFLAQVDSNLENVRGHLTNSTKQRDELQAAMTAAGVPLTAG